MNKIILLLFAILNRSIESTSKLRELVNKNREISIIAGGLLAREFLLKFISKETDPKKIKAKSKYTLMPFSIEKNYKQSESYPTEEIKSEAFLSSHIFILKNLGFVLFLKKNKDIKNLKVKKNKKEKKLEDILNSQEINNLESKIKNLIKFFNAYNTLKQITEDLEKKIPLKSNIDNNIENIFYTNLQDYIFNRVRKEILRIIKSFKKKKEPQIKLKSNQEYNKFLRKKSFKLISVLYFFYIIYHFFIKKGLLKEKKLDPLFYSWIILLNEIPREYKTKKVTFIK